MSVFLKTAALAATALFVMGAGQGPEPAATGVAEDWNTVTVVYTGDVGGKIDPCG